MLQLILWLEAVSQWQPGDRNMAATCQLGKWHALDTHHPRYPGPLKSASQQAQKVNLPFQQVFQVILHTLHPAPDQLVLQISRVAALAVLVLFWVWQCPSWWFELALAPDCQISHCSLQSENQLSGWAYFHLFPKWVLDTSLPNAYGFSEALCSDRLR